jgi:chromosome segregation ATPase
MSCFFGRAEAEKAELRDLLESANSQREEYRKAADIASRRAEQLSKQLEMRLQELNELSGLYTAVQQHEDRLLHENEGLQQQIAGYKQSLSKAAAHQEDLSRKLQKEAAARKQAETDLRKLHKEREYLKMRVDRMQHALSILENVMDDTLRVSQGMSSSEGGLKGHSNPAAALRQSMDTASVQQLQDLIQSTKLMGDTSCNGDQLGLA